jgi:hypothetical protein
MIYEHTEITLEEALLWLDRHLGWYVHADVKAPSDERRVTILQVEGPLTHWSDDLVPGADVEQSQAEPLAAAYRIGTGHIDLSILDGASVVFAKHDYLERLLVRIDGRTELTVAASFKPGDEGEA